MAELATASAKQFVQLLMAQCRNAPPHSVERTACVKEDSRDWLTHFGAQYEAISDSFITGNTLARDFLRAAGQNPRN